MVPFMWVYVRQIIGHQMCWARTTLESAASGLKTIPVKEESIPDDVRLWQLKKGRKIVGHIHKIPLEK